MEVTRPIGSPLGSRIIAPWLSGDGEAYVAQGKDRAAARAVFHGEPLKREQGTPFLLRSSAVRPRGRRVSESVAWHLLQRKTWLPWTDDDAEPMIAR